MEPVSGTGVAVIAVVVVVVGIGLWLLFKHSCRLIVSANPVTVALYASLPITATLQRKGWAFGSWSAVVPATYTATTRGNAGAAVTGSPTTAAATSATITITGAARGTDTVTISASGADCTNVSGPVAVNVT